MISESRTLAALRDTLLPKLISGELLVKRAENCWKRSSEERYVRRYVRNDKSAPAAHS